jgi:hypothetical protein
MDSYPLGDDLIAAASTALAGHCDTEQPFGEVGEKLPRL